MSIVAKNLVRTHRRSKETLFEKRSYTKALDDVSLTVEDGEAVGIIGESGSGKSTLIRLLLALDTPTSGSVQVQGRTVDAGASARKLHWLRRETGMVFQDPYASLDPRMKVGRTIAEPLWALGIEENARARVAEVLHDVHLDPAMADRYPHELSGGQRQRIAIARALVHRPSILVGDEPLSALDVTVRAQILDVLRELLVRDNLTMLFVSHDIGVVQGLCDTVAVLKDGKLVERGSVAQVLQQPREDYTKRLLAAIPTIDPQG